MHFTHNAFNIFTEIRELFPKAFFFQASSTVGCNPQYTIIGLEADEIFSVRGGRASLFSEGSFRSIPGSPLSVLQERLEKFKVTHTDEIPYGNGGAFGAFGYDLVREIEPRLKKTGYFAKLESAREEECEVEAEIHFVRNLIVFDHATERVHLVLKSAVGLAQFHKQKIEFIINGGGKQLPVANRVSAQAYTPKALRARMGREQFIKAALRLKDHIRAGDIFQAVLAERFECEISVSAFDVFAELRALSPAAYSFYFQFQNSEFFGASPETLVKSSEGLAETHPIAGTRPRGTHPAEDLRYERQLVKSVKESAEHLMLVDLARNDIGRVALPGTVEVTAFREIMKLSNVMHLISKVTGTLRPECSEFDALKACFPAGTLSGAPKIRAMEILSELETTPRGFYGGAVVAFDFCDGLDSCIAIRSVEVKAGKAILRAGAGVVADSNPESEYQEIEHKLATILKALSIAEARFELQPGALA